MPLELAILNHNKVAARILFPKTSPIQSISNWSLTGVKKHPYSPEQWFKMEQKDEERVVCLKLKGDEAFRRGDYFDAQHWYTKGIHLDGIINSKPTDAKLYSNRSMSFARLKNGRSALTDAQVCVTLIGRVWRGSCWRNLVKLILHSVGLPSWNLTTWSLQMLASNCLFQLLLLAIAEAVILCSDVYVVGRECFDLLECRCGKSTPLCALAYGNELQQNTIRSVSERKDVLKY